MATEDDLQPEAAEEALDGAQATEAVDAPIAEEIGSDASEEDSPESLASELGWCPKDEWRGNPEDWKPAPAFLRSTVNINKRLSKELKATRDAAERAARAAATITDQALERQRIELLQKRQEAFEAGDAQMFSQVDHAVRSLPQPSVPAASNESVEFRQRNAWYGVDPQASALAYVKCEELARQGADYATQLAEAEKAVQEAFPQYRPRGSKGPAQVDTGQTRATATTRKGPKGFNDLPPEAKRAAQDFERRGRASKDEYAKIYWQENA